MDAIFPFEILWWYYIWNLNLVVWSWCCLLSFGLGRVRVELGEVVIQLYLWGVASVLYPSPLCCSICRRHTLMMNQWDSWNPVFVKSNRNFAPTTQMLPWTQYGGDLTSTMSVPLSELDWDGGAVLGKGLVFSLVSQVSFMYLNLIEAAEPAGLGIPHTGMWPVRQLCANHAWCKWQPLSHLPTSELS